MRAAGLGLAWLWAAACLPEQRPVVSNATCDGTACVCEPPFDDCDADPRNGCETDLRLDPQNCGTCGRDCLGGNCNAGRCEPFLLTPPVFSVGGIDAEGDDVYFCEPLAGVIARVAKQTGTLEILETDQNCSAELTLGADQVFWTDVVQNEYRDILYRAPQSGGPPEFITTEAYIHSLSASGDTVAWIDQESDAGYVQVWSPSAAEPITLYSQQGNEQMKCVAVSGQQVTWAVSTWGNLVSSSRVLQATLPDGPVRQLAISAGYVITNLRAVGSEFYWTEADDTADSLTVSEPYRMMRLRAPGESPEKLWTGVTNIQGMTADHGGLYWGAGAGIYSWTVAAAQTQQIANNQEAEQMATGTTVLFWYDDPGKIMALAK